jgi:hypothetical protein
MKHTLNRGAILYSQGIFTAFIAALIFMESYFIALHLQMFSGCSCGI